MKKDPKYYQNVTGAVLNLCFTVKKEVAHKTIKSKSILESLDRTLSEMQTKTPDELYKDLGRVQSDEDAKRILNAVTLKIESLKKKLDEIAKDDDCEEKFEELEEYTHRIYRGRYIVVEIQKAYNQEGGAKMSMFSHIVDVRQMLAEKAGDYGTMEEAHYADPGYQPDGKPRYPLAKDGELNAQRIRAAWNYIHKGKDADKYTAGQLAEIHAKIVRAWKEKIDPEGPPGARE